MRMQKILPRTAGVLGAGAGYLLWRVLYGNLEGSIAPEVFAHLKESDAFGTLMGVAQPPSWWWALCRPRQRSPMQSARR